MAKSKKEINKGGIIPAIILISIGLIFLLSDIGIIEFNPFYLVLLIGIIFIVAYFVSKVWAFLIPGVIVTNTALILILDLAGVWYLWTLSVGAAFLVVYLTKQKDTEWAIFPGTILCGIAAMNAFDYYVGINSWPLILIGIGLYILYVNYKK